MLKYHIINLASCRLCPRRAAGGKERRYMDQNDKNKSNKNNDRRRGVLSLLIWALVLTIGFNYLLSAMDTRKLAEGTCEIRYDEFLDLVRDGKVKEVEIADRTLNITPVDGFTYTDADGKTYTGDYQLFTTQINDPELRSFLDENGVEFGKPYKAETSYLEIIMLNYVLPTALMVGAFILMMRFISKKTGGGGFGGLGSVGKSNAKVYMEKSTGVTFADVAGQDLFHLLVALDQVRHTDHAQVRLVGLHGLAGEGDVHRAAVGQDALDHIDLGSQLAVGEDVNFDGAVGVCFAVLLELQSALMPGVALVVDVADVDDDLVAGHFTACSRAGSRSASGSSGAGRGGRTAASSQTHGQSGNTCDLHEITTGDFVDTHKILSFSMVFMPSP